MQPEAHAAVSVGSVRQQLQGQACVCPRYPCLPQKAHKLKKKHENFPTENLGELKWFLGCAVERDWQQGSVTIKQPAMINTLTKRFNVTAQSDTPASTVADFGPTTADDTMVDCPFRQVVGGVM